MRIAAITLASLLCITLVSGCKSRSTSCSHSDKEYAGSQELPPLQAPPGLDPPNTRNSLKVPPLNTPEVKRGKNEPCLDMPPPFANPTSAPPAAAEPQKPQ